MNFSLISLIRWLAVCSSVLCVDGDSGSTAVTEPWSGATSTSVRTLHGEYGNIFKYGNRNAASHLWSSFLLDRSEQMPPSQLEFMFSGFCAVSGSPVGPSDYNRYRLTLKHVDGRTMSGHMHYCCWPCVCDTQDFFKVDTKTIQTATGPQEYSFVVLGNPCDHEEKLHETFVQPFRFGGETTLSREAAEVRCSEQGELIGATTSDHGFPIYNMFFNAKEVDTTAMATLEGQQPGRVSHDTDGVAFQDEHEYKDMCTDRAANGYNSGMGEIFRKVAEMSPILIPGDDAAAKPDGTHGTDAKAAVPEAQVELEMEAGSEPDVDVAEKCDLGKEACENNDTVPAQRCDIDTKKGCSDKQVKYLEKQVQATKEKRASELKRLGGMAGGDMKAEAKTWINSRINLLTKLVTKDEL